MFRRDDGGRASAFEDFTPPFRDKPGRDGESDGGDEFWGKEVGEIDRFVEGEAKLVVNEVSELPRGRWVSAIVGKEGIGGGDAGLATDARRVLAPERWGKS